ncbi:hypothetical protein ACD591_02935 [Rufibacter glacialis]|uniref:STAS/SEC14 domain-containing protein n=1 Tax=Rufibacter glacialis TaxID=1259555 RepID=A0A5M8QLI4_9BACT|nr:hypothetical protein [Rufibacter glacialis]KAA6435834.1 hypothetical protein FOE74_07840 [Rufibacter glacialis]GGK66977.1 hypothetical protein GCM10011405_13660 [Rufibacter glacialis]
MEIKVVALRHLQRVLFLPYFVSETTDIPLFPMVHTDNDYATTGHDAVLEAVYLLYKRQGTSAEFREANQRAVASMARTSVQRLFVDARLMGVVSPDDQKWVGNSIVEQLAARAKGSYLYIALVVSEKIFTKLAIHAIEEISNGKGICLNRHFYSVSEAKHWLARQTREAGN